jgi:replicative DNA helicase
LGPLQPGNVIALAGRTSMGKSAAAEVIGYNIAEQGLGVIQLNGEMTVEEMAERHLADICHRRYGALGPEYRDIRRRRVGFDQRQMLTTAQQDLAAVPLVMLKRTGLKFSQLRSIAQPADRDLGPAQHQARRADRRPHGPDPARPAVARPLRRPDRDLQRDQGTGRGASAARCWPCCS